MAIILFLVEKTPLTVVSLLVPLGRNGGSVHLSDFALCRIQAGQRPGRDPVPAAPAVSYDVHALTRRTSSFIPGPYSTHRRAVREAACRTYQGPESVRVLCGNIEPVSAGHESSIENLTRWRARHRSGQGR